jgi:UDP-glucose 4-epimerase
MENVDIIFHLAALVSVPESMDNPILCNELNCTGLIIVLEEAARAKAKKLIFSSSAAIYGDNPSIPKSESMQAAPLSPYAITKLDGEYYCQLFSHTGRLQTVSLRYFNVFGARQDPQSQYAAAVPIFITQALENMPITIYGNGEQTRDFIHVSDVAAANAYFATVSAATGVYNVAYGQSGTINDLATSVCELTKSVSKIIHVGARPGDVKHSVASVARLCSAGFVPKNNLTGGLRDTIEYYRNRQPHII